MLRRILAIDEEKCDGCGLCVYARIGSMADDVELWVSLYPFAEFSSFDVGWK